LSWLEFVATGLSPFSGQAVHFMHFAPDGLEYAKNRYFKEVERHYRVVDARLGETMYLAGDEYTIADMALWGWASLAGFIFGEAGLTDYPNVKRFMAEVDARPAAARAVEIKSKMTFKSEVDEETKRALFPQNVIA
jgi:GST-like protein